MMRREREREREEKNGKKIKNELPKDSGCGAVGRTVASDTR